jgi:hypothetical protein
MAFPTDGVTKMCEAKETNFDDYSKCIHFGRQFVNTAFLQKLYSVSITKRDSKGSQMPPSCCKAVSKTPDKQNWKCPWGRGKWNDVGKYYEPKEKAPEGKTPYCHSNVMHDNLSCKKDAIKGKAKIWTKIGLGVLSFGGTIIAGALSAGAAVPVSLAVGGFLASTATDKLFEDKFKLTTGTEHDYCHTISEGEGFWPDSITSDRTKNFLSCDVTSKYYGFFDGTSSADSKATKAKKL